MYCAGEVSVHRVCCDRATQPYSQVEGYDLSRLKTSRRVTACLLSRSMLIKMYVHVQDLYSRLRAEAIKYFRLYE